MTRIQPLPSHVVTKIAAGEIIERPASVLKELLENSIDAAATRIDVRIAQGGIERIEVVDDGCGIELEDLPLAFANHATSKLRDAADLERLATLGFRGEALASIGGVAQVTLQSRTRAAAHGGEIHCRGGQLSDVRPWSGNYGTRIEVKHLFYNTPVRRKFLRSAGTEFGHINELFARVALAHTDIHLTLAHNERLQHDLPAAQPRIERIRCFFGDEVAEALTSFEAERGGYRIHGFAADPKLSRGNSKQQYFFLNGRAIRDRSLNHALQEAYRGLLMTGRYPVAFVFLEVPPDTVDVNVHPTKAEVRFREPRLIYSMVLRTVRECWDRGIATPKLEPSTLTPSRSAPPPKPRPTLDAREHRSASPPQPPSAGPTVGSSHEASEMLLPDADRTPLGPAPSADRGDIESAFAQEGSGPDRDAMFEAAAVLPRRAIQLYNAYIVLETPEGMLVIDQHALHERILFEQLKAKLDHGEIETQPLLIPEPIDLTVEQAAVVGEHIEALHRLGLEIEPFGGSTVLLRSYPALLGTRSPQQLARAVIDHLVSHDMPPSRDELYHDLLSVMACHSAVRAGDPLTDEQIESLLAQRELAKDSHHCPHGRPTSLLFSRADLDRQFGRV